MGVGQVLLDGLLGALISALISVGAAVYAVRRTQQGGERSRREDLSLTAAKDLTAALLDAGRRLEQLSDQDAPGSRSTRSAAYRALSSDLRMATNLHAPILSPPLLADLPSTIHQVLGSFVDAVQKREDTLMREERIGEQAADVEYARDTAAGRLRAELADYLAAVTYALTAYRRGGEPTLPEPPAFRSSRV
jgi:hypothetical protein